MKQSIVEVNCECVMDHANELATTAAMPPPSVTMQTVRRNPSIKRLLKLPIWSSGKEFRLTKNPHSGKFSVYCVRFRKLHRNVRSSSALLSVTQVSIVLYAMDTCVCVRLSFVRAKILWLRHFMWLLHIYINSVR